MLREKTRKTFDLKMELLCMLYLSSTSLDHVNFSILQNYSYTLDLLYQLCSIYKKTLLVIIADKISVYDSIVSFK